MVRPPGEGLTSLGLGRESGSDACSSSGERAPRGTGDQARWLEQQGVWWAVRLAQGGQGGEEMAWGCLWGRQ